MADKAWCPSCGHSGQTVDAGGVFIESGSWDGKTYEREGNYSAISCAKCGQAWVPLDFNPKAEAAK